MKRRAPLAVVEVFLLLMTATLTGCGSATVGTSHSSYSNGISETATLNGDGTYQQVFQDSEGHTLTNSGKWEQAQPMGVPGVPNDGSYIHLDNYVSGSDLKNGLPRTAAELQRSQMFTSRSEFQPSHHQQAQEQSAMLFWVVVLRLALLAFWVYGIVDAARREFVSNGAKVGWVLVVVLLGCFGTAIYLLFGRSQGEIPAREPRNG